MVTAEELIVAIRGEGAQETKSEIEGVEGAMQDAAESAGDTAEEVGGLGERISGTMGAAVAALAVGAAGLMSQVPVLGEVMGGLTAIVQALAFQMDGVLRPVLSPISDFFYEVAGAIFEADGIMGDIIGTITTVVSVATILIGIAAKVGAVLGVWASTGAGVVSILGTVVGAITTVGAAIVSLPGLIAVAIAALVAFVAAYLTNWKGTRDKTDKIVGEIVDFVVGGFKSLATKAIDAISSFASDALDFFRNLAGEIADWADGVASDAVEWGKDIIRGMIDGMTALAQKVAEAVQAVINGMISVINAALDKLPTAVTSRLGVEQFERVDFAADFGTGSSTNARRGNQGRRPRIQNDSSVTIDGRDISESTGRYRAGPSRRQGL
jgi:hypothetical protein